MGWEGLRARRFFGNLSKIFSNLIKSGLSPGRKDQQSMRISCKVAKLLHVNKMHIHKYDYNKSKIVERLQWIWESLKYFHDYGYFIFLKFSVKKRYYYKWENFLLNIARSINLESLTQSHIFKKVLFVLKKWFRWYLKGQFAPSQNSANCLSSHINIKFK